MIKLTEIIELLGKKEPEYTPIYVPAEIIVRVWNGKTIVDYNGQSHRVVESPEEVVKKVMDYKTGIIQYQTYLTKAVETDDWTWTVDNRGLLKELAGLAE